MCVESLLVACRLIVLSDETLLARNEIYYRKRESRIVKNDTLLVINECNVLKSMIRKDLRSVESIKNKHYNAKKDIDAFKVSFQICKNKRVNVITKQIYKNSEKINATNIKSAKLYKKSTNSTKRLKSETEICRNETIKYTARNERCMNDLKKLLSNEHAVMNHVLMNHIVMNHVVMNHVVMNR